MDSTNGESLPELMRQDGVELRETSRGYKANCPFHEDRKPSLDVSLSPRGYWRFKCWSTACGAEGGTREYRERTSRPPAERPEQRGKPVQPRYARPAPAILSLAAEHYNEQLLLHQIATDYLTRRGIDPVQAKEWGIGYAPGNTLYKTLAPKMNAKDLKECALLRAYRHEDRASRRIIIPHYHSDGTGGWHTARAVDRDNDLPYLSVPGRRPALVQLKNSRRGSGPLVVTEGPFDLLATLTAQYWGAATAGNPEPSRLTQALKRLRPTELIIVPDRDAGGEGWAAKVAEAARAAGVPITIATLPEEYSDPGATLEIKRVSVKAIYGTAIRQARTAAITARKNTSETEESDGPTTEKTTTGPPPATMRVKNPVAEKETTRMAHNTGPHINFFGRLTDDPKELGDDDDNPMVAFDVAVNYRAYSSSDKEWMDERMFMHCLAFGFPARQVLEMEKGQFLWAEGSLHVREYEGNDGSDRYSLDVRVTDLHGNLALVSRRDQSDEEDDDRDDDQRDNSRSRGRNNSGNRNGGGNRNRNRDDGNNRSDRRSGSKNGGSKNGNRSGGSRNRSGGQREKAGANRAALDVDDLPF